MTKDNPIRKRIEARDFLRRYLENGPQLQDAIQNAAVEAGVTRGCLNRARADLRLRARNTVHGWAWLTPGQFAETTDEPPVIRHGTPPRELDKARAILGDLLASGPVRSADLAAIMTNSGVGPRTVARAKRVIRASSVRDGDHWLTQIKENAPAG